MFKQGVADVINLTGFDKRKIAEYMASTPLQVDRVESFIESVGQVVLLFIAICIFALLVLVLSLVLKRFKGTLFYEKLQGLKQKLFWGLLIKSYQAAFMMKMLQSFIGVKNTEESRINLYG